METAHSKGTPQAVPSDKGETNSGRPSRQAVKASKSQAVTFKASRAQQDLDQKPATDKHLADQILSQSQTDHRKLIEAVAVDMDIDPDDTHFAVFDEALQQAIMEKAGVIFPALNSGVSAQFEANDTAQTFGEHPIFEQVDLEQSELEHLDLEHLDLEHDDIAETISCVTFDASPEDLPEMQATAAQGTATPVIENILPTEAKSAAGPNPFVQVEPAVQADSAIQSEPAVQASAQGQTDLSGIVDVGDSVSKKDLVALLEGFVRIIKTDEAPTVAPLTTPTGTNIELARQNTVVTTSEASVDDRTVEIDQLRGLVIEAQDTIIKLLTDRVEDRSRIATLEAQLALIPDLQAQADRAMSVAVRTEEYRTELNKMKFELDRFRLFRVRIEGEQRKATVFNRIQKWLFSRPNAKDETLQTKQ